MLSLQTLFQARQTVVFQALQLVLCTVATEVTSTSLCSYSRVHWRVSLRRGCGALFWPGQQSEMEVDLPPSPRQFPSVLDMGTKIAVEYAGEAGLFDQRLILRAASAAVLLNTTGQTCDSTNGLFWILTPDGDVNRERLHVPPATGLVWLHERDAPILTTMTPVGCHLEQVYGFGALRRFQLSPEVIVRAVLGAQETEGTCREIPCRPTCLPTVCFLRA